MTDISYKGDPAIREHVFQQTRVESDLDRNAAAALTVLEELMCSYGMYHVMLHFSSSRIVYWTLDDPYQYKLLDSGMLLDADVFNLFQKHPFPSGAKVPSPSIGELLRKLLVLRTADNTLYLRTGTLNLFNGLVGLTFSCDGSHYLTWDLFLAMDEF